MEFSKVLNARRSIRKYKPDPVSEDHITALLEAARLAPSGLNCQPWRFVVVTDIEARKAIGGATASRFVAESPVVILCCMDLAAFTSLGVRMQELHAAGAIESEVLERFAIGRADGLAQAEAGWMKANLSMNVAIAVTHILLKATDLGLGSCWIGMYDETAVKQVAGLDDRYGVVAMVAVGHAADEPVPRPRLPLEELMLNRI